MTRDELIEQLKALPEDITFLVASDEEGNSYRLAALGGEETFCNQGGELVACHPDDLANGEYEGWEDTLFQAAVFW